MDAIETTQEAIHYTAVHTALEEYFKDEIDGKLVAAQYPNSDKSDGKILFTFAEVVSTDEQE